MLRRNFIKASGLLTGGLMLNPQLYGQSSASVIRAGVIGCGDRGKGLINVMQELGNWFSVDAICDNLDFRLDETRKLLRKPAKEFSDYRKLIELKELDAIVIATPLHLHHEMAIAALQSGRHVYLEKTMTFTAQQAIDLEKQVKKYPNQIFQVGHQYRYTPLYFKVKEMIKKGYLGNVTQIDCRWDRNWNWRRPVPDPLLERKINWRMYREYSGGLVAELLSHQIDFINWAFETHPDEFFATGGIDNFKDGRETYDNVQVVLRYNKDGMIGNFGATCSNAHEGYNFKIKGTKGMVSLLVNDGVFFPEPQTKKELEMVDGVAGATKIEWNKDGGIKILNEPMKDGTWYALKDFYESVTTKRIPVSNVSTGATTAICVHLANEAMYSHTKKEWPSNHNA